MDDASEDLVLVALGAVESRLNARLDQLFSELPSELAASFVPGHTLALRLPAKDGRTFPDFFVTTYEDRLRLQLRINGAWNAWERDVFFARPQ